MILILIIIPRDKDSALKPMVKLLLYSFLVVFAINMFHDGIRQRRYESKYKDTTSDDMIQGITGGGEFTKLKSGYVDISPGNYNEPEESLGGSDQIFSAYGID